MLFRNTRLLFLTVLILVAIITSSCRESERDRQLQNLLNPVNYSEQFNGNTPRVVGPGASAGGSNAESPDKPVGYCGDGVINAPGEHCDGADLPHTRCDELAPGAIGGISCSKKCHYDISQCITPMTDRALGGVGETCECTCEQELCTGGCIPGQSEGAVCTYDCQNTCACFCGTRHDATLKECNFRCVCTVDDNNSPRCGCSMDQCRFFLSTKPNLVSTIAPGALLGG